MEHVPDQFCVEHAVGVTSNQQEDTNINELTEATNVTSHVEERIDDSLILNDPISETELALKVSGWVNRSQILIHDGVDGQKVVLLGLMLVPNHEVAVFQLNFVVIQLNFFPDIAADLQLLVEDDVFKRHDRVLIEHGLIDERVLSLAYEDVTGEEPFDFELRRARLILITWLLLQYVIFTRKYLEV